VYTARLFSTSVFEAIFEADLAVHLGGFGAHDCSNRRRENIPELG
jgi:hypothetical protein